MTLREYAEVAGVIAVIVTLLILIVEVRDNTAATRASSYEELLGDVNDFVMTVAADPELSHIYQQFQDGNIGGLTADERYRLLLLLKSGFRNYEKAYFAIQYGTLGPSESDRFDTVACRFSARLLELGLYQEVITILTPEYLAYLEKLCELEY